MTRRVDISILISTGERLGYVSKKFRTGSWRLCSQLHVIIKWNKLEVVVTHFARAETAGGRGQITRPSYATQGHLQTGTASLVMVCRAIRLHWLFLLVHSLMLSSDGTAAFRTESLVRFYQHVSTVYRTIAHLNNLIYIQQFSLLCSLYVIMLYVQYISSSGHSMLLKIT